MVRDYPQFQECRSACAIAGSDPQLMARKPISRVAAIALAAVAVATATGFLMAPWLAKPAAELTPQSRSTGGSATPEAAQAPIQRPLFVGWTKPDVVLVLSAQQHGYLQPCGCSRPQLGGMARRYNFIQALKQRGWPVVTLDLGDVAQRTGPQTILKYKTAMEGLKLMDYATSSIGQNEIGMPLLEALGEFALNERKPRILAANLVDKDKEFGPESVANYELVGGANGSIRVGVVGFIAPSVAQFAKGQAKFDSAEKGLPAALQELQGKKADLLALLCQGSLEEAKGYAKRFPQLHVILCLTREEEPSAIPVRVGNTLIIGVGHKGRYVGVVGASRTGQGAASLNLSYELVAIGEEDETPRGQEKQNPIHALLERYAKQVQSGGYLAKYPQVRHQVQVAFPEATFMGSESCKSCHRPAYDIWQKKTWNAKMNREASHAHAFESLKKADRPSLRQFDGECVVCHTVGFGYLSGFQNEQVSSKLLNVGCENCHGPGSLHLKQQREQGFTAPALLAAMNPYKTPKKETIADKAQRLNRLDQFCMKCHDLDNDVHWTKEPFEKKWQKIAH